MVKPDGMADDFRGKPVTFSKSQQIASDLVHCISGKVNSADKLYLVIESVKTDTKNGNRIQNPNTPDGAGG
jgi:hypothetical protein